MPCRDVIPIAGNEDRAASVTVGSLPRRIVNVAGIEVMQPCIRCDPSRFAQRVRWCRRSVGQLPIRMKGREVERHVGPEFDRTLPVLLNLLRSEFAVLLISHR